MTAGQVPETIMTGNTANISHIAEFGLYDWVMLCYNKLCFPDNKIVLGRYLGPTIDTGLALMPKILKLNGVFVCRSTLQHLTDEKLNGPIIKRCDAHLMSQLNIILDQQQCRRTSPLKTWPQTLSTMMRPTLFVRLTQTEKSRWQ
jgi:hypothetical protein